MTEPKLPEVVKTHPIYGEYHINKWYPLYVKNKDISETMLLDNFEICIYDDARIFRIRTVKEPHTYMGTSKQKITFPVNIDGKDTTMHFKPSHLILASLFPGIPTAARTGYTNKNNLDVRPENLTWLTTAELGRKAQTAAVKSSTEAGGRRGTHVSMKKYIGEEQGVKQFKEIGKFKSIANTAKFLIENNLTADGATDHSVIGTISDIMFNKDYTDIYRYQYTFEEIANPPHDFRESLPKLSDLSAHGGTELDDLMENRPKYITKREAKTNRGSHFIMSDVISPTKKKLNSTTDVSRSDKFKMIQMLRLYNKVQGTSYDIEKFIKELSPSEQTIIRQAKWILG